MARIPPVCGSQQNTRAILAGFWRIDHSHAKKSSPLLTQTHRGDEWLEPAATPEPHRWSDAVT